MQMLRKTSSTFRVHQYTRYCHATIQESQMFFRFKTFLILRKSSLFKLLRFAINHRISAISKHTHRHNRSIRKIVLNIDIIGMFYYLT